MKRLLALLAVVAACTGLLAAPASAERVTGRDDRADLLHVDAQGHRTRVARPGIDLVRYAIRYGERRVSATLHYRDLARRGPFEVRVVMVATSRDRGQRAAALGVVAGPGDRDGTSTSDGHDGCPTWHRIDYRRDVVRLSAPASCLGGARAVDALVLSSVRSERARGLWVDVAPGGYAAAAGDGTDLPTVRVRRG